MWDCFASLAMTRVKGLAMTEQSNEHFVVIARRETLRLSLRGT